MKVYQVSYLDNVAGIEIIFGEYETEMEASKCADELLKSNYVFLEPIKIEAVLKPVKETETVINSSLTLTEKLVGLALLPIVVPLFWCIGLVGMNDVKS